MSLCTQIQYTGDVENKPAVTSEPDIVSIELDRTEDYIVLACDGIWVMHHLNSISFWLHPSHAQVN